MKLTFSLCMATVYKSSEGLEQFVLPEGKLVQEVMQQALLELKLGRGEWRM